MAEIVIDVEGRLRFRFDENWRVQKWDDHTCYRDGLAKFAGTTAVDIIGDHFHDEFWFVEVKDPRGHRIQFKDKETSLDVIVVQKVRDTIAAIVWSQGRIQDSQISQLLKTLIASRPKTNVVLWLENADSARALALKEKITRGLRWLNVRVIVTNRTLFRESQIPGLFVESLPKA